MLSFIEPGLTHYSDPKDWRLLPFDNHDSHIQEDVIEYALDHKILCIGLPPKTSGILQPLDVACYKSYAKAYGEAVEAECQGRVRVTKQDFPRWVQICIHSSCNLTQVNRLLPRARAAAFTRTNIVSGFERTGIYPFNRRALPIMAKYYDHLDQQSILLSDGHSAFFTPPITPMSSLGRLIKSPNKSPGTWCTTAALAINSYQRTRAQLVFTEERLKDMDSTSQGREKHPDRRRPQGSSRVYDWDALGEMKAARNAKDAGRGVRGVRGGKTRAHTRGRGSTRSRGGRGRGGGAMRRDFSESSEEGSEMSVESEESSVPLSKGLQDDEDLFFSSRDQDYVPQTKRDAPPNLETQPRRKRLHT